MKPFLLLIAVIMLGGATAAQSEASSGDVLFLRCRGLYPDTGTLIYFTIDIRSRQARLFDTASWKIHSVTPDSVVFGRPEGESFGSMWTLNRLSGELDQELVSNRGTTLNRYKCERTKQRF